MPQKKRPQRGGGGAEAVLGLDMPGAARHDWSIRKPNLSSTVPVLRFGQTAKAPFRKMLPFTHVKEYLRSTRPFAPGFSFVKYPKLASRHRAGLPSLVRCTRLIGSVLIYPSVYPAGSLPNWEVFMKWLIAGFASIALAVFCLSICTTEASADRMNGKGNCAGGVCTGGGTTWNPTGGHKKPPKSQPQH